MRLPNEVREELDNTGLPWKIETGSKHYKIRLAGRLVGIYPQGKEIAVGRGTRNLRAQVRRVARAMVS